MAARCSRPDVVVVKLHTDRSLRAAMMTFAHVGACGPHLVLKALHATCIDWINPCWVLVAAPFFLMPELQDGLVEFLQRLSCNSSSAVQLLIQPSLVPPL